MVYSDGLIWGGLVRDGRLPEKRCGGKRIHTSTQPGWVTEGIPADWQNDPEKSIRIYRYRKDFEKLADSVLTYEAAIVFEKTTEQVTENNKEEILEQYRRDFSQWPAEKGAPFEDKNKNGIYEPEAGEIPGLLDADQVLWMVKNDLNDSLAMRFYGSPPIGLEHQTTVWAYEAREGFTGTIIERHRLKSWTGGPIDSMYIGYFSDPDIGHYTNDYIGCDSIKNMGFAYNATVTDENFNYFDLKPGALGYRLLQGPVIYNQAMQPLTDSLYRMSSFAYFCLGGTINGFPYYGDYDLTLMNYNMLRGYVATLTEDPYLRYTTPDGTPTFFPLSGDPLNKDLDIDGRLYGPGDRQFNISTGPFRLEPGQTAETIWAKTMEIGTDNLHSIRVMKYFSSIVAENYGDYPPPIETEIPEYAGPTRFRLMPNYPNPFNGGTKIQFYIEKQSRTLLDVFNIVGERVEILFDGPAQGLQELTWQPENQPSGTYIIRLQAHGRKSYIKAVYIK